MWLTDRSNHCSTHWPSLYIQKCEHSSIFCAHCQAKDLRTFLSFDICFKICSTLDYNAPCVTEKHVAQTLKRASLWNILTLIWITLKQPFNVWCNCLIEWITVARLFIDKSCCDCLYRNVSANPHLCQLCDSRFTLMSIAILFVANFVFCNCILQSLETFWRSGYFDNWFCWWMMLRGCKTWFYLSLMGNWLSGENRHRWSRGKKRKSCSGCDIHEQRLEGMDANFILPVLLFQ